MRAMKLTFMLIVLRHVESDRNDSPDLEHGFEARMHTEEFEPFFANDRHSLTKSALNQRAA
jgi:hypothetical protein